MTIEEFEKLSDEEKRIQLFEAQKVAERYSGFSKYQLFLIDDFFVETKINSLHLFRRTMTCYTNKTLPAEYYDVLSSFIRLG